MRPRFRILSTAAVGLLIFAFLVPIGGIVLTRFWVVAKTPTPAMYGDPIYIGGDSYLNLCTGGPGTSWANAYVLANKWVDPIFMHSATHDYGIDVEYVTKYIIIRNCEVHEAGSGGYSGNIILNQDNHVRVESCIANDSPNALGIDACNCGDLTLDNNTIGNNYGGGMEVDYSPGVVILNNTLGGNGYSSYPTYMGDTVTVTYSTNTVIQNNTIANNLARGVYVDYCGGLVVVNNTIQQLHDAAADIEDSVGVCITSNIIRGGSGGAYIDFAPNCNVSGNELAGSTGDGVTNNFSNNSIVEGNYIHDNAQDGVHLGPNVGNTSIIGNNLTRNGYWGIELGNSAKNETAFLNHIEGNTKGTATRSNAAFDKWDNGSAGNWWGDYEAWYPTAHNNGVTWDTPYAVPGSPAEQDNYPLVEDMPPILSNPPDITYAVGTTGHSIAWTVTDRTTKTTSFAISRNNTGVVNASTWASGGTIIQNVDDLSVGAYNYTIVANDGWGGTASDSVIVTAIIDVPPTIRGPGNLVWAMNSTGNVLQWNVTAPNTGAASYTIYADQASYMSGLWASGVNVTATFDHFFAGLHNVTLVAADGYGGVTQDTAWVTILNVPPTTDQPANVTYPQGAPYQAIFWHVYGTATVTPTAYVVTRDGTPVQSGSWTSGQMVEVDVTGLAPAVYNYTINASNGAGAWVTDQVNLTVEVNYPPALTQPPDISFVAGTTGHSITWVPTDNTTFLPRYSIDVDGAYNGSGINHASGDPIVFTADNLAVGTHNVTCIYWDGCGLFAQSTVWVTVTPAGQGGQESGGSGGNSGGSTGNSTNTDNGTTATPPINLPLVTGIVVSGLAGGIIIGISFRVKFRRRMLK